jgi:adenine-specific DNA methylase
MLKRFIEVALPLKEVSEQSAREKSIRHGHISTLHIWWARRPLAACRAVVFASHIPDPDDPECPDSFRTLVNGLGPHAAVVTVPPDSNKKYLSTDLCHNEPTRADYMTPLVELDRFRAVR